jgi:endonuclease YncB( thermonuclease family)
MNDLRMMNRLFDRRRLTIAVVFAALVGHGFAAEPDPPAREQLAAKVIAYASGSAFSVLDPKEKLRRVKLAGIDTPETTQRFGAQARQLAAEYLSAKPILIAIDKTEKDARVHGRVNVDGRDVGLVLIEAGLAWCDPHDAAILPEQIRETYWKACDTAKAQRRGLWQDGHPTPPWDYRKIPRFDPLPQAQPVTRNCQDIGYQTVRCDDGKTYRSVGDQIIGSDGTTYTRRGNTITGSDGNRYEQRGTAIYGTDGSVCRQRGRNVACY